MPSSYDKGTTFLFMVNSDLPLMALCASEWQHKDERHIFPPVGMWTVDDGKDP